MTPQVIGHPKSADYRAVIRFCRERNITVQERDVRSKPLTPGELDALARGAGGFDALIDTEGRAFREAGLSWIEFDPREELIDRPEIVRLPIVRCDRGVSVVPDQSELTRLLT